MVVKWLGALLVTTIFSCLVISVTVDIAVGLQGQSRSWNDILQELEELERALDDKKPDDENDARQWLKRFNKDYQKKMQKATLMNYNFLTNLTDENAALLEDVSVEADNWLKQQLEESRQYLENVDDYEDPQIGRMLRMLTYKCASCSQDEDINREMATIQSEMEGVYGNGVVIKDGKSYTLDPELTDIMAHSRDYDELKWAWVAWRNVTGVVRPQYARLVQLANIAAQENGYDDLGDSWRVSGFDQDGIEELVEGLLEQVLPVYKQLHAYVRRKLVQHYSDQNLDPEGLIPNHILGNMYGSQWHTIYDLVSPFPSVPMTDITDTLTDQGYTVRQMFDTAEEFYTSIGLEKMTDTFWEKSMFVKPEDRPVQCHASAEDFLKANDFRIKMCTSINMDNFYTIHHEMGHIEYFMAYSNQPTLFRDGANEAFHEAIGDTIALSVMTEGHLRKIGLIEDNKRDNSNEDINESDINYLMKIALEKLAFLPYAYVMDKWRWEVFKGNIDETNYNSKYWELRHNIQGTEAPVERSEDDFDPAGKYHVVASVPYIRYFLSFIGQFQFHKALCEASGHQGPLHKCDIYQSTAAGHKLQSVLELGSSKPWPDAMETLTGGREFSMDAMLEYFEPLITWLQIENEGEKIGWD